MNIFFGFISALVFGGVLLYAGGIRGLYNAIHDEVFGIVITATVIFHLALALPCMILGVFTIQYKEWARWLMMVVSTLNLLNIPIGSAIGIYGFWVLLTPETEPLFTDRPNRSNKRPVRSLKPEVKQKTKASKFARAWVLRSSGVDPGPK